MNEIVAPVNLAALDPDEQQEVLKEVAEEFAEQYEADLKDLLENGGLIFAPSKPAERLRWYREQTLIEDLDLVLDPEYPSKFRMGVAPPLLAAVLLQQAQAEQEQYAMDAAVLQEAGALPPAPPQTIPAPKLWPLLLPMVDLVWAHFSRDFYRLEQGEARKINAAL